MLPETTFQLTITCQGDDPEIQKEWLTAWLSACGITSFVEGTVDAIDGGRGESYEGQGGQRSSLILSSYDSDHLNDLDRRLQQAAHELGPLATVRESMPTEEWATGWQKFFEPVSVGKLTIVPPWRSDETPEPKIIIEPGLAFGTGQHETSRLCLNLLQDYDVVGESPNDRALFDLGCGSGILAIGATKIGWSNVVAADIDIDSVAGSKANMAVNQVTNVPVYHGGIETVHGLTFDVILANILLPVLLELLPNFRTGLRTDGRLIVSGLLRDQQDEFAARARSEGFEMVKAVGENEWVGLALRRVE